MIHETTKHTESPNARAEPSGRRCRGFEKVQVNWNSQTEIFRFAIHINPLGPVPKGLRLH